MPKELTHQVINDFEAYLRSVANLKINTATKLLKFFKTVVRDAQKKDLITHDPFMNHHSNWNMLTEVSLQMKK